VEAVLGDLLRPLALGRDGQRAVLDLDGDVVLLDARQVERVDELVLRLPVTPPSRLDAPVRTKPESLRVKSSVA